MKTKYNIGQQGRVVMSVVKDHCNMPPYIKLVNQCKDHNGFVTLRGVKEYESGKRDADIGNLLGPVIIPFEAIIF